MPTATFTRARAIQGVETVLAWVDFYHVDSAGAATTYHWAGIAIADPSTYWGGYKEARLLSFGDYALGLSDRQGRLDGTTCSFELSDLPRADGTCLLRGFLGDPATVALRNVQVVIRILSNTDRRALADPIVVFRGLVAGYKARAGFTFAFDCQDWLSARLQQPIALWRIGDDFPSCPAANRERRGPLWYGRVSDEPSTANTAPVSVDQAAFGVDAIAGDTGVAGFGPIAGGPAVPTGLVATEVAASGSLNLGDVPSSTYRIMVTRVVGGVESDPTPFLGDTTTVTITANGAAIHATCTADGATVYRFYIGFSYYGPKWSHYLETATPAAGVTFTAVPPLGTDSTASNITPGGKLSTYTAIWYYGWTAVFDDGETQMGVLWQAVDSPYRRPMRTCVVPLAGPAPLYYLAYRKGTVGTFDRRWRVETTHLNADGNVYFDEDQLDTSVEYVTGAPTPAGIVLTISVGSFVDLGGASWEGFALQASAVKTVGHLYLDGVVIDAGRYGVDVTAPDHTNFATYWGATRYRIVNGHRWTLVYLRGPDASALLAGTKTLTANLEGVEATGDGTGALLTSLCDQIAHLCDNFVLPETPYTGGNWLATPTWADGSSKRDAASFTSVKTAAAIAIPAGNTAAWGILTADPLIDILAARMLDGDTSYGFTKAGQFRLVLEAPDPTAAAALTLTDVLDILEDTFDWEDDGDPARFFNDIAYDYAPIYAADGSISYAQHGTAPDVAFQARYHQVRTAPWTITFGGRRGPGASGQIAARIVDRAKRPPRIFSLRASLYTLSLELGDLIALTHREGPGATGATNRLAQIRRISPLLDLCAIGFNAFDVGDLVSDGIALFEEAMASRTLGGSRENDYGNQADGTYDIPEWRPVRVNWDQVPAGWVVRARVWCNNDAGASQTPRITDLADVLVIAGVADANTTFTEQLIVIARPGGGGEKFYKLRSTIAGAAAKKVWTFGEIEIVSS